MQFCEQIKTHIALFAQSVRISLFLLVSFHALNSQILSIPVSSGSVILIDSAV